MSEYLPPEFLEEMAALIRLHRCPVCHNRGVLTMLSLPAVTVNAAGDLLQLTPCSHCKTEHWIKCNDMGQHFRFTDDAGGRVLVYAINVAEEIVAGRNPNFELSPADMGNALATNDATAELDPAWIVSRDLSKPIILIPSPVPHPNPKVGARCIIVIDGWHRMAKACLLGVPMKAHALSEEEAAQCLACITSTRPREGVPA